MQLFTSDREQRLWLCTLAVVVAIYSTLGPAGTLVAYLRERNLLRVSVALVLFLVAEAIAGKWVKRRPGRGEIGVVLDESFQASLPNRVYDIRDVGFNALA